MKCSEGRLQPDIRDSSSTAVTYYNAVILTENHLRSVLADMLCVNMW